VAGVFALGVLAVLLGADASGAEPTVEANHETLPGARGERYPQVASFKGIPYAAAPLGALR